MMQAQPKSHSSEQHYFAINRRLFEAHVLLALWTLFGAALAARLGGPNWGWSALAPALLTNGYWAVLHEALHGNLAPGRRENRFRGRMLAILFGTSFRLLRFAHLSHHWFNRHPLDCPDVYDPARRGRPSAYLRFLGHILGGQYLGEVVLPVLFWLPASGRAGVIERLLGGDDPRLGVLRDQARHALGHAAAVAEIRADVLMGALVLAASVALWGEAWPFLAGAIALRALLVSFLDNVYHHRTPIDRPDFARNLRLPMAAQSLLLNTNLHQVHHRAMHLPWWRLKQRFLEEKDRFHGDFLAAALSQLRGPAPINQLRAGQWPSPAKGNSA